MNPVAEFAPQVRRKSSTFSQMMEFFGCVIVLWASAIAFYWVKRGMNEGIIAIFNGLAGIGFALAIDLIWEFRLLWNKENKGRKFREYFYRVFHSYSFVSGLLVALLCPIGTPWWVVGIGASVATFVAKTVFGGFGMNIMNPAIFGRLFLQFLFSKYMVTYVGTKPDIFDVTTGASLTNVSNGYGNIMFSDKLGFTNIVLGNYFGTLGETLFPVLAVICIYLCVRKIIDWRIPVFYIGGVFLSFVAMFLLNFDDYRYVIEDAFAYTLTGGVVFGGVLCLTDPVTSPTSKSGRIVFALVAAIFTVTFRTFGHLPEGVAYSILIANFCAPAIDKMIKGRTRRTSEAKLPIVLTLGLLAILIGIGAGFGWFNPINPQTGEFLEYVGNKGVF